MRHVRDGHVSGKQPAHEAHPRPGADHQGYAPGRSHRGVSAKELQHAGIRKLKPHFYLSDEWGVNFGTIAIAIPFYLARSDLTALHAERTGLVEGVGRTELLRYLRHEMGHVVNYAYQLYDNEEWIKHFGSMTQPYEDDYRPQPFSKRFVRRLPGWYAQKHPDEDWAETFAVWMTPNADWRTAYADWPEAFAKLQFCDRIMAELNQRDPLVTLTELEEITLTLEEYYQTLPHVEEKIPPGLDGAMQTIFENADCQEMRAKRCVPAAQLLQKMETDLVANIYRWTGHFPERTRPLFATWPPAPATAPCLFRRPGDRGRHRRHHADHRPGHESRPAAVMCRDPAHELHYKGPADLGVACFRGTLAGTSSVDQHRKSMLQALKFSAGLTCFRGGG